MIPSRRSFLHLAAATAVLPALPRTADAQAYPARPVRVLVAVSPGGTTDLTARLMAQWLAKRLGQPFVIENRPGGATNIATELAVRSPPDGYTLFMANSSNAVNESLYPDIGFKFSVDLTPVSGSIRSPLVMLVNPGVPAATASEFIASARPPRRRNSPLMPGRSRQDQHGFRRQGRDRSCRRRAVPDDGRRQIPAHPLSRRGAGDDRPDRRAGATGVRDDR